MQRVRCGVCVYRLQVRACVKNRSDFSGTSRAYWRRRLSRMRNGFGATASGPASNSSVVPTISVFQDAHSDEYCHYRPTLILFKHDENVRSPMALGRILSDPDLRVGHSYVGIPQPRRKGNFWRFSRCYCFYYNTLIYIIFYRLYLPKWTVPTFIYAYYTQHLLYTIVWNNIMFVQSMLLYTFSTVWMYYVYKSTLLKIIIN